jgi:predicted ATPase/class 3 adenylate cyclase
MIADPRTESFLFTDLENSTLLWESQPDLMQELVARHDTLIRQAIEAHRGRVVKTTGDGFHAAFETASEGVAAAVAAQLALAGESWPAETGPLRVRMGLHTGESRPREGDYYGAEVNRAARVMAVAYGGQILISEATAALIRHALPPQVSLTDLGEHRLKGLAATQRLFQVNHPDLRSDFPPLKSLSAYEHNLPVQLSAFVGRQHEVAEVERLLKECHLLTLLGPGGTGKTRLMLEVAEEVVGDYNQGVWLVELAPLSDPGLIPERIAASLHVQEQPGRAMSEALVDFLRRKELLLLLDNVEHLVRGAAESAEYLLTRCPGLKIIVTGREALLIRGEVTLHVPSLSLPEGNGQASFEEICASEGVQLFLTRAREYRPDFELNRANASTIAEIVRRLDGIPLALELAAARTRMLSVAQIAERLNDRFRLLKGGRRTALARQQTLQAMIDWSWNLLDEQERLLLRRLSVFSGGWSLEAAQAVAGDDVLDEYEVFDLLEQLVNKSLVTVNYPAEGEARYAMLESILQYGRDRLAESGEGSALHDRHADYYVAFAEEVGQHLARLTMLTWVDRLIPELDNLRAALAWTLEDHPELSLRIAGSLLHYEAFWLPPREARAWLEPAIAKTRNLLGREDSPVRPVDFVKALIGLTIVHGIQGRTAQAIALAEENIQLARAAGQLRLLAYAIILRSIQTRFNMSPEALHELEEAIAISRENRYELELEMSLGVYGLALELQGKSALAKPFFDEAIELNRSSTDPFAISFFPILMAASTGDREKAKEYLSSALENYKSLNYRRGIAIAQSNLAHLLRQEGNLEQAEAYYRQSVVGWQEQGHLPAVAHEIECFAFIAIARGQFEHAARLLGAARKARQRLNALSDDPLEVKELAAAVEQLAEAMGEEQRDDVMAEGSSLTLDDAVQLALAPLDLRPDD